MIRKTTFLSLLLLGGFFMSCKEQPQKRKQVSTAIIQFKKEAKLYLTRPNGDTIQQLEIEIADDEYERETGLMYRTQMKRNRGMLFIFPEEQPRGFYMKNTHIPLDLIFLNSQNKIVSITRNATPESLETIPSNAPAQYVLEINSGLSEEWNLQAGDSMILKR
jgi:uncharacterized membrane protein (UPF0127 family)